MKLKYSAFRFIVRATTSGLLAFLFVFFPGGQNVFASCTPATNGDDNITCTSANDMLDALDGNDQVNGGAGNDTLTGGGGNDTLVGGSGNDTFVFDTDTALGTDIITEAASGGTDTLNFSGSSNDIAINLGTTGNQVVNANLTINMTAAQVENVTGGSGNDSITGNTLSNLFTGGAGNDVLTGGTGNDTYAFDTDTTLGTDSIVEVTGGGTDTLNFTGSGNAVSVNLGTIGNQVVNSNLTLKLFAAEVENATGGNGGDTLTGNALANTLSGGNGNDTLNGMDGNDTLTGGAGNDFLTGGAGNDSFAFDTDTALGTDTITEASGGGTDALNFTGSSNAITVNLGIIGSQTVNSNLDLNLTDIQIENVTGGSNNDTITGNAFVNSLSGGAGNDILNGMDGNDTLTGGDGNDSLIGGAGNDSYAFDTDTALGTDSITEASGGGTDALNFTGSSNAVTVDLGITGNQVVNTNLTLNLLALQVENVTGGSNNDTITGNALNNLLSGGSGNDTLNGMAGNDTLTGGAGDDSFFGGTGNDSYTFDTDTSLGVDTITENIGEGTDTLDFTGSSNAIAVNLGTIGNQVVNSNLTLNLTTAEMENVTGGSSNDIVTGNALNNVLSGGTAGNDTLNGMDGNDTLTGGAGTDSLFGGAGNDSYAFDTDSALGIDTITEASGDGMDTLDFTGSSNAIAVNLGTTGNQIVNSNLTLNLTAAQVENVTGGSSNDTITGNAFNNVLSGGTAGNDVLNGLDGNDTLTGGAGTDSLLGGAGDDTYSFDTDTALGTDTITEAGGNGTDVLDFTGSSNAITVNLGTTGNQVLNSNLTLNLTAAQMENVTGGSNNDTITGNALNNVLSGGTAGNDTLNGMDGNDTLTGGAGTDSLFGGAGDDTYTFDTDTALGTDTITETVGNGTDALDFTGSSNAIAVNLGTTGNQVINSNLTLNLAAAQIENVTGGSNNDTITGNAFTNVLFGGMGNDVLNGDAGADILNGGDGVDALNGGTDDDQLNGDAGTDILNGGDGADTLNGGTDDDQLNGDAGADILNGGDGADTLNGGADDDQLNGDAGNDTVNGGDGNDTLITSLGIDVLDGGAGDDQLVITGIHSSGDVVTGGGGVNVFVFQPGTSGYLELVSNGDDALDFSLFDSSVTIDLNNFSSQNVGGGLNLTLTGLFTSITGTVFNDSIIGNSLNNVINGLDGDDTLNGGAGNDTIQAGPGNDTVNGGLGIDVLNGDAGADVLNGDDGVDTLNGGADEDQLNGGGGDDMIQAGPGDDTVNGGSGTDILDGEAGIDTVVDYEAGDSHISIENGIVVPTTPPVIITSPESPVFVVTGIKTSGNFAPIIPATGKRLIPIECDGEPFILNFGNDNWLTFYNLCDYTVSLDADMAGVKFPENNAFLYAMSIDLLKGSNILTEFPQASKAVWKIPSAQIKAVYFSNAREVDAEKWTKLELNQVDGYYEIEITQIGTYLLAAR